MATHARMLAHDSYMQSFVGYTHYSLTLSLPSVFFFYSRRSLRLARAPAVARLQVQRAVGSRVLEAHTALLLGLSSLGLRPVPDRWSEAPAAPAALTAPAVPTPSAPGLLQLA